MADADENGVADSLEQYLAGNGFTPPPGYDPASSDLDADGLPDMSEWILGTDPLASEPHLFAAPAPAPAGDGSVALHMQLPDYFGNYAEVFGRENLCLGDWEVVDGWIPTYGAGNVDWTDAARTNAAAYFYLIFDATMDWDGDGFSDHREHFVSGTDPSEFNHIDSDGDGMHDWYEIKLFGDLSESPFGDFDGDGLANGIELVWDGAFTVRMYSDPSLFDTDNEGLDDGAEVALGTDPWKADTDGDGIGDAVEALSLRTDPNNPDTLPPVVAFGTH